MCQCTMSLCGLAKPQKNYDNCLVILDYGNTVYYFFKQKKYNSRINVDSITKLK